MTPSPRSRWRSSWPRSTWPRSPSSIQKIKDSGALALAYDRAIFDAVLDFTATGDNVTVGRLSAETTVKLLTEKNGAPKGIVMEQMGDLGDSYAIAVDQGFSEVMAKYPDITFIKKDAAGWENTIAARAVDDVLTANPTTDVVFMQSDFMGPAIVPVLQKHGFSAGDGKLIFLGAGGGPPGLDLIRQGWLPSVIEYPVVPEYVSVIDAICLKLAGKAYPLGEGEIQGNKVVVKDEKWGPTLWIQAHEITKANVDDPNLWGNFTMPK